MGRGTVTRKQDTLGVFIEMVYFTGWSANHSPALVALELYFGASRRPMARRLGVTEAQLSYYLSGSTRLPTAREMIAVAMLSEAVTSARLALDILAQEPSPEDDVKAAKAGRRRLLNRIGTRHIRYVIAIGETILREYEKKRQA